MTVLNLTTPISARILIEPPPIFYGFMGKLTSGFGGDTGYVLSIPEVVASTTPAGNVTDFLATQPNGYGWAYDCYGMILQSTSDGGNNWGSLWSGFPTWGYAESGYRMCLGGNVTAYDPYVVALPRELYQFDPTGTDPVAALYDLSFGWSWVYTSALDFFSGWSSFSTSSEHIFIHSCYRMPSGNLFYLVDDVDYDLGTYASRAGRADIYGPYSAIYSSEVYGFYEESTRLTHAAWSASTDVGFVLGFNTDLSYNIYPRMWRETGGDGQVFSPYDVSAISLLLDSASWIPISIATDGFSGWRLLVSVYGEGFIWAIRVLRSTDDGLTWSLDPVVPYTSYSSYLYGTIAYNITTSTWMLAVGNYAHYYDNGTGGWQNMALTGTGLTFTNIFASLSRLPNGPTS